METKLMNRRSFMKKGAMYFLATLGTMGLFSSYALFGEKYKVQIKQVPLTFDRLPVTFNDFRMVQFSDAHFGRFYNLSEFEKVVSHINGLQPDLICFTGDLYDQIQGIPSDECISMLSALKAKHGKWAVLGNHDYGSGAEQITILLEKSGFIVLKNDFRMIERGGKRIRIAGIDDVIYGKANLQKAMIGATSEEFTLLLVHEPDYADKVVNFNVDFQISGHSHGGQVRLPWVGALLTPQDGEKYVQGHYTVAGSKLQVYTNRGIGMSILPIRFLCRPEITVFELRRSL